ncbi:glycosyltransferase [Marinicella sediminis]|uniref:GDP-Man:Man(1)GlcNAc(2)-PP-Dol alpha-1,3-mannosyltransferase n=1 Tax=Marinicella sediminis TaxID=1792834 RepID=A0ABV7JBG8_9GAMM|nr:glycosyltransferase [Marinicella sediminis]
MPHQIQIIHDLFQIKGGGERLVMTLCEGLPADLLTAHIGEHTFDLTQLPGRITDLDALSDIHGIKTWSLARAFRSHQPSHQHPKIIYSGVASPLAITHHRHARNVFYCHTPPRFIYDKRTTFEQAMNPIKRWAFKRLINWFQPQYEQAVRQMDVLLTNSEYVRQRIQGALQLQAQVVYPPCDTNHFKWLSQGDFYLSLARHDSLKRIDAIIRAFLRMPDKQLVVASGGAETEPLKQLAGNAPNIHFTGWLSETQLLKLLGQCLATIYVPLDEDFGMTPVESMSAGKPVIAADHGGLLETMLEGETGYLVSNENLDEQIMAAVQRLSGKHAMAMRSACEARAQAFSHTTFLKKIKEYL